MKNSKNNLKNGVLPQLQKSQDEVRNYLLERIHEGEEKLLNIGINNETELEQARRIYYRWKSLNEKYLQVAFSTVIRRKINRQL